MPYFTQLKRVFYLISLAWRAQHSPYQQKRKSWFRAVVERINCVQEVVPMLRLHQL